MRDVYRGVKYYGKGDLSTAYQLRKAADLLEKIDLLDITDVNRVLELANVKAMFDNDLKLSEWSDEQYSTYQTRAKQIAGIIGRYFSTICDENIKKVWSEVSSLYFADFWGNFMHYECHTRVSANSIKNLLEEETGLLRLILEQKELVRAYADILTDLIMENSENAEYFIEEYMEKRDGHEKKRYFPDKITNAMKLELLSAYVSNENPNPNYLQLIVQYQNTKEMPIMDEIKLLAKRKLEAFKEGFFKDNPGMTYGCEVIFAENQKEVVTCESKDLHFSFTYDVDWIKDNQDYATLLNNFIYVFEYEDLQMRSQFVSLQSEVGTIERLVGVKGIKEYVAGSAFNLKHMLYSLQMHGYLDQLEKLDINLENVFKWFFEEYLKTEFGADDFIYHPSSAGTTYMEKCVQLAKEMDAVLKQFDLYCKHGTIDRELFEMSSAHVVFNQLLSMLDKKYVYVKDAYGKKVLAILFSNSTRTCYDERTNNYYNSIHDRFLKECVNINDLDEWQKSEIDFLINAGILVCSDDGIIHADNAKVLVLHNLYTNEVVILSHVRYAEVFDELEAKDIVEFENSLFTRNEQEYLNYVLNKSEFSNGLDLRNKYIHGTNSLKPEQHKADYIELLKVMVLVIIKINQEFCLRETQGNEE